MTAKMWRREITFGARIPRGWRMAWYEPQRGVAVYFPAPLHWLASGLREFIWRVSLAWRAPRRERQEMHDQFIRHRERQRLAEEYTRGYLAGWRDYLKDCLAALDGQPDTVFDAWPDGEDN